MPADHRDARPGPRLVDLLVADPPSAWSDAGFHVEDGRVRVGTVGFTLAGAPGDEQAPRGITGWRLSEVDPAGVVDGTIDGLPTELVARPAAVEPDAARPHPNGVVGLDHVVVATPDLERTIEAFAAAGLDLRRIRGTDETGTGLRQAFFRLGPTIVEVVSGPEPSGETAATAPASWFGIAVDVADLDASAALLGPGLGRVKAAVQPGRRIATLRHQAFAMTVAVAAMDDGPSH